MACSNCFTLNRTPLDRILDGHPGVLDARGDHTARRSAAVGVSWTPRFHNRAVTGRCMRKGRPQAAALEPTILVHDHHPGCAHDRARNDSNEIKSRLQSIGPIAWRRDVLPCGYCPEGSRRDSSTGHVQHFDVNSRLGLERKPDRQWPVSPRIWPHGFR